MWANPIATFLSVAMMLDFLGQSEAAAAINQACQDVVADPKNHTRDLGGHGDDDAGRRSGLCEDGVRELHNAEMGRGAEIAEKKI